MSLQSWRCWSSLVFGLLVVLGQVCRAQEADDASKYESTVEAPPNTREMGKTLGGAFYVDKELYERYETLKARLAQVREDIARGDITSDAAEESLSEVQEEADRLREEIEQAKVLVSAFNVYSKTSEEVFPLGDEKLVIITGDHVIVRGWEGPGLKCDVEKIIVAKEPPDDDEFDEIQVKHELRVADDMVGLTKEQRDQQEEEYLNSEAGRALTDEQRASRRRFVEQIHHDYDDYTDFQGRECNTIELTGQEGNRNLLTRINSPGGGGSLSSQWNRHARLTVYVPPCKSLAVRGCMVGLDIQNVECDLVLTTHGSRNRDHEGSFTVRGVKGNVMIDQAPVRELSGVTGNITFNATNEFVNSGVNHSAGGRTSYAYETRATRIEQIGGDLHAEFLRTDLTLSAIEGLVDVVNRFGATHLMAEGVRSGKAHRILSQSGEIRVTGPFSVLEALPIYAYTQAGRLQTNLGDDVLQAVNFSTGRPQMGWRGVVTPPETQFSFGQYERPAAAIENLDRSSGLDLISHAGVVSILTDEESSR